MQQESIVHVCFCAPCMVAVYLSVLGSLLVSSSWWSPKVSSCNSSVFFFFAFFTFFLSTEYRGLNESITPSFSLSRFGSNQKWIFPYVRVSMIPQRNQRTKKEGRGEKEGEKEGGRNGWTKRVREMKMILIQNIFYTICNLYMCVHNMYCILHFDCMFSPMTWQVTHSTMSAGHHHRWTVLSQLT